MENTLLEMRGVTKEFFGNRVLDRVDLSLRAGEVHALLGANGAGKSTLMKILNGIYSMNSGEILLEGNPITIRTPREAYQHGIIMIHQELDLVGCRNVAENIYLGRELYLDRANTLLDRKKMQAESQQLLDELGFNICATDMVEKLAPAQQQLILIARTVSSNSKIVVMDEPTSSLSHTETQQLFKVIHNLRQKGISVIYISHYLEEVFEVSDRLTVLRDGAKVATANTAECTTEQLIHWMIGREMVVQKNLSEEKVDRETILECKGLTTRRVMVKDVDFAIHRGEIVGFAGVVGSGRSETARMVYGAEKMAAGQVVFDGKPANFKNPVKAVKAGIGMVPEDRKTEGLVLKLSISVNMWLSYLEKSRWLAPLNYKKLKAKVQQMIEFLSVKCASKDQLISDLSGGNQQKVVIGKCLMNEPKLLILDQPTRGVDVGAKSEIYQLVTNLTRDKGTSILYISDELEELIALCDRIYVIKQGQCVKELNNHKLDITKGMLLEYMVN